MKEIAKGPELLQASKIADRLTAAALHTAAAALGFFMARTKLWGGIVPLGIAFAAGMPFKILPASAAGVLAGYVFPLKGVEGFRYAAALLAVTAIRFILNGIKPAAKNPMWSAVTAAAVLAGVGVAAAGTEFMTKGILGIAEGLIAGGGAYFIRRAAPVKDERPGMTLEQTASVLISVNLILTALFPVSVGKISLGRIAAVTLILFAARYGRIGIASVCSTATAAAVCISGGGAESALAICFSGPAAGLLAGMGRLPAACAPASVTALWVLVSSASGASVSAFAEAVTAGIVFMIVPRTVGARLGKYIAPPASTPDTAGLRRTLTMRLSFASAALRGVSETVEEVSRCLAITKKPDFSAVLREVENDACKGCSFLIYCWEKQRETTVGAVLGMSDALRRCRPVSMADIPEAFAEKCLRMERFEDSISRHYSEYLSSVSAERRVTEMRGVVSDQMNGIADMLEELSEEFRTAQNYDVEMAGRVASSLKELGLRADECSCVVDKYGRMTVEIKLAGIPEMPINRARILSHIEEVCDRDFEPPEINRSGRTLYITAAQKTVYAADCFCTQFNQGKNRLCGDTCRYFLDGRGRLVSIVSDGMGSGGRAAVDSAMTAGLAERLIKAGFGYDCTLKLVNSAMLFKSSDESLATLDISCIDLFSGKTELLKAGAAPTLVRRNGRTGRAECRSLPTGILNEVGFDRATVTLKEDDILLMMSDGVCTDGTDWICAEIEKWRDGGAKQLSEHIATAARRRRSDGHDDDITVFAAILQKAV